MHQADPEHCDDDWTRDTQTGAIPCLPVPDSTLCSPQYEARWLRWCGGQAKKSLGRNRDAKERL